MAEEGSSSGGWFGNAASGGMIIAPILDTLISTNAAKKAQNRQNRVNRSMADLEWERNLEMWNRMNEYNSPSAQMERLKNAGLNPNLVYGKGADNTASTLPRYNAPDQEYKPIVPSISSIGAALANYQDVQLKKAQIDQTKAVTRNVDARTLTEAFNTELVNLKGKKTDLDVQEKSELANYFHEFAVTKMSLMSQQQRKNVYDMMLQHEDVTKRQYESEILKKKLSQQDILKESYEADMMFRKYRTELMKMGINTGDHIALRMLMRILHEAGIDPMTLTDVPGMKDK